MSGLLIDVAVAIATGFGLWAVLPRGVVLTRSARTQDWRGQPMYDTWELRNDSALPIKLTSVTVSGAATLDSEGNLRNVDLPRLSEEPFPGVSLTFDDAYLEISREEHDRPWKGIEVPPGDTLQACVGVNSDLHIKYRRAGLAGVFERRQVRIHGHT